MRDAGLSARTAAPVHLGMAERYWREDRLEEAAAAMAAAMEAGLPATHLFDLQRMIDAELATRRRSVRVRVAEELEIEGPAGGGSAWCALAATARSAIREVTTRLEVRWPRPVLVTLVPDPAWVTFVHARYGYYATRSERHKVVLPPSAWRPVGQARRALLHEIAHAAVACLTHEGAPRWLDEGVAVWLEGGLGWDPPLQAAWPRFASLAAISGALEGHALSLDGEDAALCYTLAGNLVHDLVADDGAAMLSRWLRRIGSGEQWRRAYAQTTRTAFWRVEWAWRRRLAAAIGR